MKLGSLCSGAGGLDTAVEQVFRAETVWHCENNPAASKVLSHRWPGVPNYGDLTTTDWATVEPVDIVCAGWPCQPFSLAGQRRGAADERAIWPSIAGAIRILRPRYIVLENVSAVLVHEFGRVADSLATLGYDISWTCLRASDVGAPHRRERVFVVAADTAGSRRQSERQCAAEQRSIGCRSTSGASDGPSENAAYATGDGRHEGRPEPARLERGSDAAVGGDGPVDLLPTPKQRDYEGGVRTVRDGDGRRPVSIEDTTRARGDGGASNLDDVVQLLPTPRKSDGDGGANPLSREERMDDVETRIIRMGKQWGKYGPAIYRWEQLVGPAPSPTEPNSRGNPRLNPEFSSWMMGWPAGWVTAVPGISRNDALRIIGNGVVPQQAAAALAWLLSRKAAA